MKNTIYYLLGVLLLAFGIFACTKDNIDFKPDPGKNYTGSLIVTVLDEANNEVADAHVSFQGVDYTTNQYGFVKINNTTLNSKHNVLNASKSGYFNATKVFAVRNGNRLQLTCILQSKVYSTLSSAANGGSINTNDKVNLTFPAAAIKYESNGQVYNGEVRVAIRYFNPESGDFATTMPGNLTALTANEEQTLLKSYGMIQVEMESPSGEKLNIADGKKVSISSEIPDGLLSTAPATLPMWHFDEADGLWKEEGKATRSGNRYVGEVSHFSTWNFDGNVPTINISGRIIDQNGNPISNATILFSAIDNSGTGYGTTQSDGSFSGPVAKDKQLRMTIYDPQNNCNYNHSSQFGPYSADTDLGDITITFPGADVFQIDADLKDCSGNPITNGRLKINLDGSNGYNFTIYPDDNGHVYYTTILCNNYANSYVKALDLNNLVESDPISIQAPGVNNLGNIAACGNEAENITINIPDLGFNNVVMTDSLYLFNNRSEKNLSSQDIYDNKYLNIFILWGDGDINNYLPGTYGPIPSAYIVYSDGTGTHYTSNIENLMLTVTQGGPNGSKIRGNFNGTVKDINQNQVPINGTFYATGF